MLINKGQKNLLPSHLPVAPGWQRFCTSLSLLFLLLLSIISAPILALLSFSANLPTQNIARVDDLDAALYTSDKATLLPVQDPTRSKQLLTNIPRANSATSLRIPNYQEDRAVREALLAHMTRWETIPHSQQLRYVASNQLQVYFGPQAQPQPVVHQASTLLQVQSERTVLTARIVLGLWNSRRYDPALSLNGSVAIRADEILAWRGVQKHQRIAYPGANKRFSDGYQEKHKQQVTQDMELLQQYYLRGSHTLIIQGRVTRLPVDSPYLDITPLLLQGVTAEKGYLVSPGRWIDDYETYQHFFLADVNRKIFQLNPQNDQLALRIALYLSEHWRQEARGGHYKEPLVMSDLLAASMISVDKANLTSRFAPRVEAALQKLYVQGILGAAPTCLSCVDRTRAQWGNDWLAAYWSLLPPI